MRVCQHDGIDAAWRRGHAVPVAQPQLLEPLEQPAIDEQTPAVVLEQIARSGHGAGGTEEVSRMCFTPPTGQDDLVPRGSRPVDAHQAPSNTAKGRPSDPAQIRRSNDDQD
jgi:hypothetical protein